MKWSGLRNVPYRVDIVIFNYISTKQIQKSELIWAKDINTVIDLTQDTVLMITEIINIVIDVTKKQIIIDMITKKNHIFATPKKFEICKTESVDKWIIGFCVTTRQLNFKPEIKIQNLLLSV